MIANPVPWPNGARVAVAFTWDEDADSILHLMHPESSHRKVDTQSLLRYGPDVGVPRLVELARRQEIKMTFFLPAWVIENYPRAAELIVENGHELAHHGYIHEMPNEQSPDAERYWLEKGCDIIERVSGRRPVGYRAPWFKYSNVTTDLLIDEGFLYDASLMGDDVPYVLRSSNGGEVIELPSHWAMDDYPHYAHIPDYEYLMSIKDSKDAMRVFREEFDAMWEHRGLWVTIWHPFNSARLARCVEVEKLIEYMQSKGDVWFATTEEIATHVRSVIDDGTWTPRVDEMPYFAGPVAETVETP
jgi:peptidoglycan/xylan/chitin deacetylase (PgdA/CDA1 family)